MTDEENPIHEMRRDCFWGNDKINKKTVAEYLRNLKHMQKEIRNMPWEVERILVTEEKKKESTLNAIDREITFCTFYFVICKESKKQGFDTWTFVKKEEVEKNALTHNIYGLKNKDCWIRWNGRIKALVTIDRTGVMAKIELEIRDASVVHGVSFYERHRDERYSHAKAEESISKRVEEYKATADDIIKKCTMPIYCEEKRQFEIVSGLLNPDTATEDA